MRGKSFLSAAIAVLCFVCFEASLAQEDFNEELLVRRLPDGHIYTQFRFVMEKAQNHTFYGLFPKSMADLFSTYNIDEMHLSITQGLWRHRRWGYAVGSEAPTGTELWAYFKQPEAGDLQAAWKSLTNSLSGAFCTAIQSMDGRATAAPRWSFRMEGVSSADAGASRGLYGALSGEMPCTNTLTPWTKFLPCYVKAGLATLLEPHRIFDASYASIGLHFSHACPAGQSSCRSPLQRMTLSLSAVFNPKTTNLMGHVSLQKLFSRDIPRSCPLASKTRLLIDIGSFGSDSLLTPPSSRLQLNRFVEYDLANIAEDKPFDFSLRFDKEQHSSGGLKASQEVAPLVLHRYLAGFGQQSGAIVCQIENRLSTDLPILYFELFPWFVYAFVHSLKISSASGAKTIELKPSKVHYVPSKLRQSPGHLELALTLPARSLTTLAIDVEYQLLRWTEYPPDANHGFYIPAAAVSALLPRHFPNNSTFFDGLPREFALHTDFVHRQQDSTKQVDGGEWTFFLRLYTESLIVYLPTPDFSMPYNALCLVCTVVAIGFGSVHSLTTKRFVLVDPENPPKSSMTKAKEAFANLKNRLLKRKDAEPEKAKTE